VLGRYRKSTPSKPAIIASLMAYATNIGLGRMADICNLSYQELSTTAGNYIRLETLKEANDRIANATARLPIFRHFDIDEAVHSSSDSQKFEAAIPTINARHSAKYFGLSKGVAAYTLLANHVPLNARIIGANEHESHLVFDILFNNATDILPAEESHEAGAVGIRQHHPHPVPAGLHRLAGAATQRPEGAQPRRGLPPAAPRHRLRARRPVPGQIPA
jgi:hypothetical protein